VAGVDHVIALGLADPERLGVMGWSYGSYVTSRVSTQTNRFKAAAGGVVVGSPAPTNTLSRCRFLLPLAFLICKDDIVQP